jgi:NADH-quinone oxidoreductase subunit N
MNLILPQIAWQPIVPLGLLALAAVLVLLGALFMDREEESTLLVVALAGVVAAGYSSVRLWNLPSPSAFGGMLTVDHFALAVSFVVLLAAGAALVLAYDDEALGAEYLAEILLAALGMMVFAEASNLLVLFLGLEILSLPLYVLAGMHRDREGSREAAVKYVLMGALSSGVLLYGMALLYGATGSMDLATIGQSLGVHAGALAFVGLALILVGMGFKLALFPFHSWVPDVYQGSPTAVTAFMSVGTKAAAFAALARTLFLAFPYQYDHWQGVMWAIAALTMLMGNLMALRQTSLKRLLGYSGIAHAGYLAVTLVAGTALGVFSSVYYLVAYAFMNLGALAVVQGLSRGHEEGDDLATYRGLFFRHPLAAGAMVLFLLSLASIPPTAGFLAKLTIFLTIVRAGAWPLAAVMVVATLAGLYVYLKVVMAMFDRTRQEEAQVEGAAEAAAAVEPTSALSGRLTASAWVVVAIAAWGTLQLGILPGPLLHLLGSSPLLSP